MAKEPGRVKKRERKNITSGVAHVNASFNNTMITITDAQGNAISWSSAGTWASRVRASRPRTPPRWLPKTRARRPEHGVKTLEVNVSGPGSGRESALRALQPRADHHDHPRRHADPAQRLPSAQASSRLSTF
jgi:small subunit ribosomal protein S11